MDRESWGRAFTSIGYSIKTMMDMDPDTFKSVCKFIIESGYETDSITDEQIALLFKDDTNSPKRVKPQRIINRNTSFQFTVKGRDPSLETAEIRCDQDAEYNEALRIAQQMEAAKARKRREEAELQRKLKEEREALEDVKLVQKQAILDLAQSLGDEPEDGVPIVVQLPNRKRITRKFKRDSEGSDVYTWVSAQNEMFVDETVPLSYDLVMMFGQVLDKEKTLDDQKVIKKTLINVMTL